MRNALRWLAIGVPLFAVGATEVPERSCAAAEHRQLDFTVGNWILSDRAGVVVGTVTITPDYGGCVLIEKWRGIGDADEGLGVAGYRAEGKTWHRDFIDHAGFVLALDGRRDGNRVVMTGKDYQDDVARLHRVTWSPRDDGTLEQLWQTSTDAGRSWHEHRYVTLRRISE